MISISGWIGYFSNNLFQIAAAIGAAVRRGEEYSFPRWRFEEDLAIEGCFHEDIPPGEEYKEPHFHHEPIPDRPDLRLYGYFQSEKYFAHCRDLIRSLFALRRGLPHSRDIASIQVRRGNYLNLPRHHPVLGMDYYREAIELLRSKGAREFLVFSDDLPWCRENDWGPGVKVLDDKRHWTQSRMDQMALSMSCRYHVMANSTFSWWCAWLCQNPDKVVIAPKRWFGPAYAHYDMKDLYCPGWIVI